jgi:protein gp37
MAENTSIEWCDHTWSPVWGCTEVSKAETGGGGCDNCYARTLAHRFGYGWNGEPMREFGEHHWNEPLRWDRRAAATGTSPRVFPSMCDPFDKDWPAGVRERFFRLIADTPHLTWLLLTKRIGNAAAMIEVAVDSNDLPTWPWPHVWLGASMVNQQEYDRDIGKLLRTSAARHFVSFEPMLGPIDMRMGGASMPDYAEHRPLAPLSWVIAGGESGPHARPAHPDWFRSLRDQCAAAGVPFMHKQWGEWLPINQQDEAFTNGLYRSNRIAKPHEDQRNLDDLCGRTCTVPHGVVHHDGSFHEPREPMAFLQGTGAMATFKVGKKSAGRLLDGVTHDGFPA